MSYSLHSKALTHSCSSCRTDFQSDRWAPKRKSSLGSVWSCVSDAGMRWNSSLSIHFWRTLSRNLKKFTLVGCHLENWGANPFCDFLENLVTIHRQMHTISIPEMLISCGTDCGGIILRYKQKSEKCVLFVSLWQQKDHKFSSPHLLQIPDGRCWWRQ